MSVEKQLLIDELKITLQAALTSAQIVAENKTATGQDFELLLNFIREANETVRAVAASAEDAPKARTIFPTYEAAAAVARGQPDHVDKAYSIARFADGKCRIDVYERTGCL